MRKEFFSRCLTGAAAGIAVDYLAALIASASLHLGYFMPCPSWLPERVGGEMNAVIFQMALCALAGAGVGAARHLLLRRQWRTEKRVLCALAAWLGFLAPALVLCVGMLR